MSKSPVTLNKATRSVPLFASGPSLAGLGSIQIETRPALSRFLSISPSLPKRYYSQADVLSLLGLEGNPSAEAIFERSKIDGRHLALPETDFARMQEPHAQLSYLTEALVPLAEEALKKALEESHTETEQLGCLLINTTSALIMPSLSAQMVSRLQLPPSLLKFDLTGAGCLGALPTLTFADNYLASNPDKRVLAVCVDIGSQFFRAKTEDKATLVVNSLFADAAVGMVLGRDSETDSRSNMPEVVDFHFCQGTGIMDSASIGLEETGARTAFLHRELPDRSVNLVIPELEAFLVKHSLTRADVSHWIIHPGGRAILDQLQEKMQLSDEQLMPSRETLRRYGNASSPTCMLVLNHAIAHSAPKPGDVGILVGIGPGLTVGMALLRWPPLG